MLANHQLGIANGFRSLWRIDLRKLQHEALGEVSVADANRIELLDAVENGEDLVKYLSLGRYRSRCVWTLARQ